MARALGNNDLPSNTICKVLDGFGKSSTKSFNEFCSSQVALRRGSFYSEIVCNQSLQARLCNLLANIEATYLDFVGGNSWDGIAPLPAQLSFWADRTTNADDYECEARALAAKSKLPWDDWVKLYADCHYCGK